ncbi:hypothetical protein ABPG75_006259 [Micractinium tetrahymenae]
MAGLACRSSAFPTALTARPRPLRSLAAASAAHAPSSPAGLAAQLRQLKQLKVWDAPASSASASSSRPAARGGRAPAPARGDAPGRPGERPGAAGGRCPGIVWFRGDLRLHDHEALSRAQAECSSLLPVYCFDPRDYGKSPQGYDKTGPYRARFLTEAVASLRQRLRAAGSELVVRLGRPEEVIAELVRKTGAGAVYCHTEVSYEELQVEAAVKGAAEGAGARFRAFWANTLCHLEDLPFRLQQLPQNFDKFKQQVEALAVRAALPAPTELRGLPLGGRVDPGDIPTLQQLGLQPLPTGCGAGGRGGSAAAATASAAAAGGKGAAALDGTARGGEGEAVRQLRRFVAQVAGAAAGRGGSGGSVPSCGAAYGSNFASSIAPWLATGCLSPRHMLEDVQGALSQAGGAAGAAGTEAAAAKPTQQHPLTWVRFELLWRDFFRFMTLKYSSLSARQLGGGAAGAGTAAAQPALAAAV